VDHAQLLDRPFPWRTAAVAAAVVALAELLALLALAGVRLAPAHRAAAPERAATATVARAPADGTHKAAARGRRPATAKARPLRVRSRISVLVLNGNGVPHAAGNVATRLLARGYRHAVPADAQSHHYARSLVLFTPGYEREAHRLARDAGIRAVSPLDGMRPSQLRGSQLVVILGGS
jgi:LytR cell envelope-related transcriptional attenuator